MAGAEAGKVFCKQDSPPRSRGLTGRDGAPRRPACLSQAERGKAGHRRAQWRCQKAMTLSWRAVHFLGPVCPQIEAVPPFS